ncbi:heterokaryon incompatibility protein-domain-containing protein [Pestalotiopsis sp. NC0098]|nr:heterokaryon incompatibility protein-domain-containing protein [Pestalotiopsis sp. NC0098]
MIDKSLARILGPACTHCPLCNLLRSGFGLDSEAAVQRFPPRTEHVLYLEAWSYLSACELARTKTVKENSCFRLFYVPMENGRRQRRFLWSDGCVVCLPKERQDKPCIPRAVPEQFDIDRARSWLRICKEEHGGSCKEVSELVPGMRLIDCDERVVVKARPQMIWVALSYVWGDAQPASLLGGTSKTMEDAIKVTKDLGYRYLWIDQFCIDQDDDAQKQNQIAKMDAIYRGADLTIIASAGKDSNHGLPGVGTTRRKQQLLVDLESWTVLWTGPDPMQETGDSTWWHRGWTFQEGVLSRRRLFFTDRQSWFECGNAWWKEGYGGPKEAHSNCSDRIHTYLIRSSGEGTVIWTESTLSCELWKCTPNGI